MAAVVLLVAHVAAAAALLQGHRALLHSHLWLAMHQLGNPSLGCPFVSEAAGNWQAIFARGVAVGAAIAVDELASTDLSDNRACPPRTVQAIPLEMTPAVAVRFARHSDARYRIAAVDAAAVVVSCLAARSLVSVDLDSSLGCRSLYRAGRHMACPGPVERHSSFLCPTAALT